MPTDLALRGLTAEHTNVSAHDDQVSLELVSLRTVTVEFHMTPAAASALASDLVQVAETLRNASDAQSRLSEMGMETTFAPLARIVDAGLLGGRNEVYLTLETEYGPTQRFRFAESDMVAFARSVLANAGDSGIGGGKRPN